MTDILSEIARWLAIAFLAMQLLVFVGAVGWIVWIDAIKPRLIPRREIERMADEIIAAYPDPEEEAFTRHQRAWFCSDGAAQVYWRRVRGVIRKRLV